MFILNHSIYVLQSVTAADSWCTELMCCVVTRAEECGKQALGRVQDSALLCWGESLKPLTAPQSLLGQRGFASCPLEGRSWQCHPSSPVGTISWQCNEFFCVQANLKPPGKDTPVIRTGFNFPGMFPRFNCWVLWEELGAVIFLGDINGKEGVRGRWFP